MKRTTVQANRLKDTVERERTKRCGPPPEMWLKQIRQEQELSLEAMASRIGISKQALIRLEQGTYERILPSVLEYYLANYVDSELRLVESYELYQAVQRKRHWHYFGETLITEQGSGEHPFRQLRNHVLASPTEVAKALCIPQATIEYFEKKYKQQKTVPKGIINVLFEIGYTNHQIDGFMVDYELYRRQQLGTNVVELGSGGLSEGSGT